MFAALRTYNAPKVPGKCTNNRAVSKSEIAP